MNAQRYVSIWIAVVVIISALAASSSFAQSTEKTYKWMHPWFKTEFSSPNPPPWPYRILEEKSGIVLVEVTPPGTTFETKPAVESKPAIEPKPINPTPSSARSTIDKACEGFGPLARASVEAKQKGVPLSATERVAVPKNSTPEAASIIKSIVRSVYNNNLTEENAEAIVIQACQITYGNLLK